MAQPIQIILMRQLAGYLSVPTFGGPNGDLLFYNEPAETYSWPEIYETGAMSAKEWSAALTPEDFRWECDPARGMSADDHDHQKTARLQPFLHPRFGRCAQTRPGSVNSDCWAGW